MRFDKMNVLITGAASGIGKACALSLADKGARLILCDINEVALKDLQNSLGPSLLMAKVVDISDEEAVGTFATEVLKDQDVDILINNAGVGLYGSTLETSIEDWEWVMGVNFWGTIYMTKAFAPSMVQRGSGRIVNIASVLGLVGGANTSAYSSSKFAVVGFSEALQEELRQDGIKVSVICPGVIDTAIITAARGLTPGKRKRVQAMYKRRRFGPEKVARAVVRALEKERFLSTVTPEAWIFSRLQRLRPALGSRALAVLERVMSND